MGARSDGIGSKPKTFISSTCGMLLLLAMTKECGGVIGLPRGFWKMMNLVFRVEMRKPRVESQEWILCSAACRMWRARFALLERRWMLRSSEFEEVTE